MRKERKERERKCMKIEEVSLSLVFFCVCVWVCLGFEYLAKS